MRGAFTKGARIRQLRQSLTLTQEELASRASCDVKTLRAAESGRRIDVRTLHGIAAALAVSPSEIIETAGSLQHRHQRIRRVREWQRALQNGDVDALLRIYRPDAVVRLPWFEAIPGSGVHQGSGRLRRVATSIVSRLAFEPAAPRSFRVHAAEEFVFLRGQVKAALREKRKNRREVATFVFHEFCFQGNDVREHVVLIDTARVLAAFDARKFSRTSR
jgi:transcriptional regulator with XRE-family HTH domain